MESLAKMILLVAGALFTARTAYACMCAGSHPQQQLCKNGTFAALVKIRNVDYVYTTERPKHKTPKVLSVDRAIDKDSSASPADGDKEAAPKPDMEKVEVVVKDLDQLSQKHFVASHIRYRVKVYETYKGLKQEEVQGKKIYIYTAPNEAVCGINLEQKEMYLLIGNIYEDRLTIGLCDHYFLWNSIDSKQRKVVRKNMRETRSICESSCHIQFCWSSCPKPDKDTCMWTAQKDRLNSKFNIHQANYVCTREPGKQDARCVWNDPLSSVKRGRRRRRHHEAVLPTDLDFSDIGRSLP